MLYICHDTPFQPYLQKDILHNVIRHPSGTGELISNVEYLVAVKTEHHFKCQVVTIGDTPKINGFVLYVDVGCDFLL